MYYLKLFRWTLSLLFLPFMGCDDDTSNHMFLSVSGNPGEVILVTTTNQWTGKIGDAFKTHFEKSVYGMPQAEPIFNLVQTNTNDFLRVFKTFRNVIIVEIDTNRYGKAEIEYRKNVYANGQLLIKLKASSRKEVVTLINKYADQITRIIQTKELNRLIAKYRRHSNKKIEKDILTQLGVNVTIPKEAVSATSDTNHVWVRIEREKIKGGYSHQISQGILIFKYHYTAQQQFLNDSLFKIRDEKLKLYIEGSKKGSYMTTEYRYYPPLAKEINYKNHFSKEIHGLWRMEGDFMGGPMVSYFVLDEEKEVIYCISGYAYAPQFNKREYYREVEAIAKSIEI